MKKDIKVRKKRRTREPFLVISEWKGKRNEETRWDFSKEDVQKSIDKMIKNYQYFYNDKRSPYVGNPDRFERARKHVRDEKLTELGI